MFLGEVSSNTELGAANFAALQEATVQKASKYTKWTDNNRYSVGKYASEHGNAATALHFKKEFPNIKESTVREFKKKYEKQLQKAKEQNLQPPKSIKKYFSKTGRSLLLGKFDLMVQNNKRMSNRGAVITWFVANAATKALIKKYKGVIDSINLDSSSWA